MTPRRMAALCGVTAILFAAAACKSTPPPRVRPTISSSSSAPTPTVVSTSHSAHPRPKPTPRPTPTPTPVTTSAAPTKPPPPPPPVHGAPLIVIDPGHSVTVHGTDPATGLDTSDYENEPEMRDMYSVALIVRQKLLAAGYRVVMTKPSLYSPTNLGVRAYIANAHHAALALSIHDQAGSNGGISFDQGNSVVYYQSVGDYRENPQGRKIYFTDSHVAAVSRRYGEIFQRDRARAQGRPITLLGNTGYDLGSRGLQSGNIWIVQLLSHVPWIYNEAGGNSAGMSGLDAADKQTYADGLVASVEDCVPIRR